MIIGYLLCTGCYSPLPSPSPLLSLSLPEQTLTNAQNRKKKMTRDKTKEKPVRTRKLYSVLPQFIAQDLAQRTLQIEALFKSILPDISADTNTLSAYRYQRNISDAIQEYLEAASFRHYITTGTLISIVQAQTALPAGILLTVVDYFGGILDLIGELMRLGITIIATTAPALDNNPTQTPRILSDLREFRRFFDSFDLDSGPLGKELDKKMATMRTSVDKVERAVYGMFVRGRERPPGWVPDVADIGGWGGGVGWEADAIR